jgi:hypothetical protein
MSNNRIGDACWYLFNGNARNGIFRAWGQDTEEYNGGPGTIPVGVVEDDATKCLASVPVNNICFAAVPPWPRERGGVTE